jgi:thiamine kinase-like enzyme
MMVTGNKLRKLGKPDKDLLSRIKRRVYGWQRRRRRRRRPVQGLPEGIALETVNELCLEHLGEPLQRVSYVHLSGWKVSGAYRLFLKSVNGRTWHLIYKNAIYSPEQIPALKGLPIRPGPPEYLVYKHPERALSQYLPTVYLCLEVIPERHYQYILEDVSQSYQRLSEYEEPARKRNILKAAAELPRLHHALSEWSITADPTHLLRFDREFSTDLLNYAKRNLECYVHETADKTVSRAIELWPLISEVHGRSEFYECQTAQPIHGDYHTGHVHVHKNDPDRIKVIDWEWTGLGRPHADLATLLQRKDPDTERQALVRYAEQDEHLSLDEHKHLYEWCQLERGLLNAAFLASQQMESSRKVFWIPGFIQGSIMQALHAQEQLI